MERVGRRSPENNRGEVAQASRKKWMSLSPLLDSARLHLANYRIDMRGFRSADKAHRVIDVA